MSRRSSTLALIAVIAASAFGYILARMIPSAVFPEITFRRATILADSGDLPAEQMLASVTRALEETAYSVVGVTMVRSTTTRGSSEIDVTFGEDADPVTAFEMLSAAVAHTRSKLPADTQVDAVLLTTGTFPILDISMSSKTRNLTELTDIANYELVPSLHLIEGTYRVEVVGAKYREFVVRLDPARMIQHEMSPADVVSGMAKNNVIASAGRMNESHRMLLTVVTTDLHQADQIAALPIATTGGQLVRVSDVASVELGIKEDYVRTASENGAAVLIGISRRPGGNTVQIAADARRIVDDFRTRYPDVKLSFSYDQSDLVTESFNSVRDAIILGLVLAVLVVLAFTMSPISAIVAAIVVPCTVAITCVVMKGAGLTFNMMTLGGLAAGIGLFIDDAIVMIEAIHRELATGESTETAVSAALKHLGRPLFASTMTVIVVFAPLVFLSGVTGVFSRSLAATLGGGLAISLVLAIYFTPAIELAMERFRRQAREPGRFYHRIESTYLIMLRPFVRLPALAVVAALISVAVAYGVYKNLGSDYLPPLDEGAFILDYVTPPQSTLADTTALLDKIQNVLVTTPEVVSFSRRTGTQLGFFLTESNRGDMSVRLKHDRARDIDTVIESIRQRILRSVPGVRIEFSQILQDMIGDLSGTPEPVEVKVFGTDQASIEATARKVAERMRAVQGLVDVNNGIVTSIPEQELVVDQIQAARYGLSADDIHVALNSVIAGTVATNVLSGDRLIDVRVRYPDAFHEDNATLSEVLLKSSTNARVPLAAVTKLNYFARVRRALCRPTAGVQGTRADADRGNDNHVPDPSLGICADDARDRMPGRGDVGIGRQFHRALFDRHDAQHFVVHGHHHGRRDHREERDPASGPRRARSRIGDDAARRALRRREGAAAPDYHDDARDRRGFVPTGARIRRGRESSAAACDRGYWRTRICDASFDSARRRHLPVGNAQGQAARARRGKELNCEFGIRIRSRRARVGSARASHRRSTRNLRANAFLPARFSRP